MSFGGFVENLRAIPSKIKSASEQERTQYSEETKAQLLTDAIKSVVCPSLGRDLFSGFVCKEVKFVHRLGKKQVVVACQIPASLCLNLDSIKGIIGFTNSRELRRAIKELDLFSTVIFAFEDYNLDITIADLKTDGVPHEQDVQLAWPRLRAHIMAVEQSQADDYLASAHQSITDFVANPNELNFKLMYFTVTTLESSTLRTVCQLEAEMYQKILQTLPAYWLAQSELELHKLPQDTASADHLIALHKKLYPIIELLQRYQGPVARQLAKDFVTTICDYSPAVRTAFLAQRDIRDAWKNVG